MRIEKQVNELTKEVWGFTVIDRIIYLDSYHVMTRESTRARKYRSIKQYERIKSRDNTLTENEVPFTDELRQEVLNEYFKTLKCLKWSERKQ
jgi:hypothetical protein